MKLGGPKLGQNGVGPYSCPMGGDPLSGDHVVARSLAPTHTKGDYTKINKLSGTTIVYLL